MSRQSVGRPIFENSLYPAHVVLAGNSCKGFRFSGYLPIPASFITVQSVYCMGQPIFYCYRPIVISDSCYEWESRIKNPKACPSCKRYHWEKESKREVKG